MLVTGAAVHEWAAGRGEAARAMASQALERWVSRGLAFAVGADGRRVFDLVEVVNAFKWAGLNGEDEFWRDHWVCTGRMMTDDQAALEKRAPDRRCSVKISRLFNLSEFAPGADLLLRAPLPLDGSDHQVVDVAPEAPEGFDGRVE